MSCIVNSDLVLIYHFSSHVVSIEFDEVLLFGLRSPIETADTGTAQKRTDPTCQSVSDGVMTDKSDNLSRS